MADPLHQFEIKPLIPLNLGGIDVSFTNASLWMVISFAVMVLFLLIGVRKTSLIPGKMQSMAELSYEFIGGLIKENIGNEGRKYFPIIFSIFIFVLGCNLMGLLPYSFTVTSHIIVTFAIAFLFFIGITLIGLFKHGFKFFGLFLPDGVPLFVAPLMIIIEIVSYFSRPVSLAIRLTANMLAGHIILKVLAGFVISLGFVFGLVPLALLIVLTGFEFFVAFMQAYIFAILACVYLNDVLHLH